MRGEDGEGEIENTTTTQNFFFCQRLNVRSVRRMVTNCGLGETMPVEIEIRTLLQEYGDILPTEVWALLATLLAGIIFIANILNPILSLIYNIRRIWTPKPNPNGEAILRPEIRVLKDVWLRDRQPNDLQHHFTKYRSTKVVTVLNMKGGVGKTTLTGNIGAAINSQKDKSILFIDYDYQGTLSLMLAGAAKRTRRDIGANSFLTLYKASVETPQNTHVALPAPFKRCAVSGASYYLFRDEMEQFAKWAAGELDYDVRTQLRSILETDYIQESYDIVLIDCGPRFTTSTIAALCASTHVLVPTILDEASIQAVTFLDQELSAHRPELFPNLELIGLVPMMVNRDAIAHPGPTFSKSEKAQLDVLHGAFHKFGVDAPVLREARIPRRAEISRLADRIAYYESAEARRVFDRAAEVVLERIYP